MGSNIAKQNSTSGTRVEVLGTNKKKRSQNWDPFFYERL